MVFSVGSWQRVMFPQYPFPSSFGTETAGMRSASPVSHLPRNREAALKAWLQVQQHLVVLVLFVEACASYVMFLSSSGLALV